MRLKREGIWHHGSSKRGRLAPMAALVAATILFAVWALVFHHHNLAVFIVGHYVETLALLPTLTLLGLLTIVVAIDAYIRPDLKRTMRVIIAVVFSLVIQDHLESGDQILFQHYYQFIAVQLLSCGQLFVTPWTSACQASPCFTIS